MALSRTLPKLSAMAAVKYAPPAMPPRKKYQTITQCHSGDLSIAVSLAAALAESHDRAHADHQRRADRQERVREDVPLRQERLLGQIVGRGLVEQEEERIEAPQRPRGIRAVQLRVGIAHVLQLRHAR